MDKCMEIIKKIDDIACNYNTVWYRGTSKSQYKLSPGLFRKDIKKPKLYERKVYARFISLGYDFINENRQLDILMKMQHYGIRTRLLDWTENVLVALYFASKSLDEEGAIWIVDPYKLNKESLGRRKMINPTNKGGYLSNYGTLILNHETDRFRTQAFRPQMSNKRIVAQNGKFTFHGTYESLETEFPQLVDDGLHKILIDTDDKESIQKFLAMCSVSEATLFPELDKLGSYIHKSVACHTSE